MTLVNCFKNAARMGVITAEEAKALTERFNEIARETTNTAEARARMAQEIEAEAQHRERAAILTEIARARIVDQLNNYRTGAGQIDLLQAWLAHHEYVYQDTGASFVKDAETLRETIARGAQGKLRQIMRELRRGAIVGDLRRTSKMLGSRKAQARMDNFVRELFGDDTGDATAKTMAEAWTKVAEDLRVRFNGLGGNVGKLDRWGLPQSHDALALLDATRDGWVSYMMQDGVLDRERTVHPITRKPMSDGDLRKALEHIWEKITTDGWSDKDVSAQPKGKGALYTQHADHRFLHFKNADAWMAYARQFGNGDPFAAMMGHISSMSRDIAQMEVFGPNPNATREWMKSHLMSQASKVKPTEIMIAEQLAKLRSLDARLAQPNPAYAALSNRLAEIQGELDAIRRKHAPQLGGKPSKRNKAKLEALTVELDDVQRRIMPYWDEPSLQAIQDPTVKAEMEKTLAEVREPIMVKAGVEADRIVNKTKEAIARADSMWHEMRGEEPVNVLVAHRMSSVRNFITATSLGSAWLSSINDPAFGQDMRLRIGMGMAKANVGRLYAKVLGEMAGMMSRDDAIAAGLGLDSGLQVLRRQARQVHGVDHGFWTGWLADRTLTWGLLSPWTQAGKHIAGLDFMRFAGQLAKQEFTALPKGLQDAFRRHGFDAASWEQIRRAPLHEGHLRPNEIEVTAGRELAERYLAAVLREVRYAVPESTVRSRSLVTTVAPKGTVIGEMVRSMGQFKGFSIAVLMLHAARIAREAGSGNPRNALAFGGGLLITATMLGAVAMTLKDIKDGRDPRRWLDEKTYLDPKFWGAAFMQSGGQGILGDLLFADVTRSGNGLETTIAGPLVGRLSNIGDLLIGAPIKAMSKDYNGRPQKANVGDKAVKVLRQNVPFANHWLISAAYQRVIMDQLQRMVDPEAQAAFNRQIGARRKDYGQEFWWQPGDLQPRRGPRMSRMIATH